MGEFGVEALSDSMKTPTLLYMLYCEREQIHNKEEFRARQQNSAITEDRIRKLIYSVTGDKKLADKAAGYLVLQETKRKQ